VLKKVIGEESSAGVLGDITGILKWGAILVGAYFLLPVVTGFLKKGQARAEG